MKRAVQIMRLLAERAKALGAQTEEGNREAANIERTLREHFSDVWCIECGQQAIRHTAPPEMTNWNPQEADRNTYGCEQTHYEEVGEKRNCPGLKFGPPSQAVTIRRVLADRPAQAPGGWIIFAATRPLDGTTTWENWDGPSFHGRYYAAIDPHDPRAAEMIDFNAEYDGWILEFVTMEQVHTWAEREADEDGFSREDLAKVHKDHLIDWWATNNHRVIGEVRATAQGSWQVVAFDNLKCQIKKVKKMLEGGDAWAALALLGLMRQDLPDRATWDATQAEKKLAADGVAADQHLDAVLEKIGPHKYED